MNRLLQAQIFSELARELARIPKRQRGKALICREEILNEDQVGYGAQMQIFDELARDLAQIPSPQPGKNLSRRQEILNDYQFRYGVRPNTFRRWQRAQTGTHRSDAGRMRKAENWKATIQKIFELQCQVSDFEGGRWMAADKVLQEAERRGIIEPGSLSERNYNLWLRKFGLRSVRGVVRFGAEHSNQVHQMDVSGSAYLTVTEDLGGGEYALLRRTPRSRLTKEQKEGGYRLWVAGIVDDYSRLAALRYVVMRGESAAWLREFLWQAWKGFDPALALRGIPEILYCDNGPFARAQETRPFLSEETGLGVQLQVHQSYRARSTGKIERIWRTFKNNFEGNFLTGREEWTLTEVNDLLLGWCMELGERKHPTMAMTRSEAFTRGLRTEVRLPNEDALRAAYRTYERVVDAAACLRLENKIYRVPVELRMQRVLVYRNAKGQVAVEHLATGLKAMAEEYEGPRGYGDFESQPETIMDAVAKEREAGKWGEEWQSERRRAGGTVVPFIAAGIEERKATPFDAGARFANEIEAKGFIARELGIPLLTFRREHPRLWEELCDLVRRTLSREEITAWASGIGERVKQAAGGGE